MMQPQSGESSKRAEKQLKQSHVYSEEAASHLPFGLTR